MGGTREGGLKAAETLRKRKGDDFYKVIGTLGGRKSTGCGFADKKVGADGLTGAERAKIAGARGGAGGKGRRKAKKEMSDVR